jgi:hypothetical protein
VSPIASPSAGPKSPNPRDHPDLSTFARNCSLKTSKDVSNTRRILDEVIAESFQRLSGSERTNQAAMTAAANAEQSAHLLANEPCPA